MLNSKIRPYWDAAMRPVGRTIARSRISPDVVTVTGVAIQGYAAYLILEGRLFLAAVATAVSGIADVLDGAIAKAKGRDSRWGALFDSTTDRLTDALIFLPLAWLYGASPDIPERERAWVALLALVALVSSFLVSYVKARAESLGFECNVGIAERAERVLLVIVGLVFNIIPIILAILATLAILTFFQRLIHVYRQDRRAS